MNQSPNPPAGGTPQQPGGWSPRPGAGDWQSDPTQQLPAAQPYPPTSQYPAQDPSGQYPPPQYPPTQPLPAQGGPFAPPYGQTPSAGYPGSPQFGPGGDGPVPGNAAPGYGSNGPGYGSNAPGYGAATPGNPGGPGAPGNGAAGQYGPAAGQYGPAGGSFGPPGGSFGAPPSGGDGYGGPPAGGRGRNPLPLIIGIVAGVLVLGVAGWYFLRPGGSGATPSTGVPTTAAPSPAATPSVLVTPSSAPPTTSTGSATASPRPSGTTAASCATELSKIQCDWAVYLRKFVQINTCRTDSSDMRRDAVRCLANARGKLKGTATVTMRWADDSKDLTGLMDGFFSRAGVPKSKIGKNWKKPPAHTNWWYTDTPKKIEGKLGSANATDGSGRVAWTFSKQRFFIEATSDTDDVKVMIDWWART